MMYLGSLLALGFAMVAPGTATPVIDGCQPGDMHCLDRHHEKLCAERTATAATCLAWIRRLEQHSRNGSPELLLRTGQAYEALAQATSSSSEAKGYRDRAIQIYREMIRRDSSDAQAILALAVATEDKIERIRLLKQGIALAPNEIYATQLLASELGQSGKAEDAIEAARLIEGAYLRQTGRNKWYLASSAYQLYLNAGAPQDAARFRRQVLASLDVQELKSLPPDAEPDHISRVLVSSCDHFIVPVIGSRICMENLEIVVQYLTSRDDFTKQKELASVAANAMIEVTEAELVLVDEYPDWMNTFRSWLQSLLEKGFESSALHFAIARVTSAQVRLNALKRAASLEPMNGQAALRLGVEYSQLGMWEEAAQELTRARLLVPSEQRRAVDYHLETARKKLAEKQIASPR